MVVCEPTVYNMSIGRRRSQFTATGVRRQVEAQPRLTNQITILSIKHPPRNSLKSLFRGKLELRLLENMMIGI